MIVSTSINKCNCTCICIYYMYFPCSQKSLSFPDGVEVSDALRGLVSQLLTDPDSRLGFAGLRTHAFFSSVDWDRLQHGELRRTALYQQQSLQLCNLACFKTIKLYMNGLDTFKAAQCFLFFSYIKTFVFNCCS